MDTETATQTLLLTERYHREMQRQPEAVINTNTEMTTNRLRDNNRETKMFDILRPFLYRASVK